MDDSAQKLKEQVLQEENQKLKEQLELLNKKLALLEKEQIIWKVTEEALRQTEEKLKEDFLLLKTLIDHLPSSIFVLDKNYRKTIINKAHLLRVADTTGIGDALTEEDLLGKTNYDIYSKIVADEYQEEDRKVIEDGETILNREELCLSPLGEEVWEQISKIPMKNKKDEIIGMVGIALNTTRIKKAEARIDQVNQLIKLIEETAKVGGWEFDIAAQNGNSTSEVRKIFDFDDDRTLSIESALNHFVPDSKLKIQKALERTVTEGIPFDLEVELISKKGIRKWIRTKVFPVYENNKIVKIQGTFQDISDMRK